MCPNNPPGVGRLNQPRRAAEEHYRDGNDQVGRLEPLPQDGANDSRARTASNTVITKARRQEVAQRANR